MNKYISIPVALATLCLTLVACGSGNDGTPPPRTFPNLPFGKCKNMENTPKLTPSIYPVPKPDRQHADFHAALTANIDYWEVDNTTDYSFTASTHDNPGGRYWNLKLHPNDCTAGDIGEYTPYGSSISRGPLDNKFMVFSSCHTILESSTMIMSFKSDYRIEPPEEYDVESPTIIRHGTLEFSCPWVLTDRNGQSLPTKSKSVTKIK